MCAYLVTMPPPWLISTLLPYAPSMLAKDTVPCAVARMGVPMRLVMSKPLWNSPRPEKGEAAETGRDEALDRPDGRQRGQCVSIGAHGAEQILLADFLQTHVLGQLFEEGVHFSGGKFLAVQGQIGGGEIFGV